MKNLRNSVTLIGRLGGNPEIVEFGEKGKLAKFTLATDESHKDKNGNKVEETQWHRLVMFGAQAKLAEKYLTKGSEICIEGRLVTRSWDDKDGKKQYMTEVHVNDFLFIGSKKESK